MPEPVSNLPPYSSQQEETSPDNSEKENGTLDALVPLLTVEGFEVLDNVEDIFIEFVEEFKPALKINSEVPIDRRYSIMTVTGEQILAAGEVVDCRSRCWRGMQRRYCMYIFSMDGQLLFTSERQKVRCCTRKPPMQEAETGFYYSLEDLNLHATRVHLANGDFIGQIRNLGQANLTPKFFIDDETCSNIMKINGQPCGNFCTVFSCKNSSFTILDMQHNGLGKILKTVMLTGSSGSVKYCFSGKFPSFLPPVTKALILAAMFDLVSLLRFRPPPYE